jgi:hypothetical protein
MVSLYVLNNSKAVKIVVTTPEICMVLYYISPISRAIEKVKFTWSSACHLFSALSPTYPIGLPRATAPNIDRRNESEVFASEKAVHEKNMPSITLKEITPVVSLKSDSPSMTNFSL